MSFKCCVHCRHTAWDIHPDTHPVPCRARWCWEGKIPTRQTAPAR